MPPVAIEGLLRELPQLWLLHLRLRLRQAEPPRAFQPLRRGTALRVQRDRLSSGPVGAFCSAAGRRISPRDGLEHLLRDALQLIHVTTLGCFRRPLLKLPDIILRRFSFGRFTRCYRQTCEVAAPAGIERTPIPIPLFPGRSRLQPSHSAK